MSIRLEMQDQVARILISHPARMNALGEAQIRQLEQISHELGERAGLRVILLKAEGEVFGAGGDLRGLAQEGGVQPRRLAEATAVFSAAMLRLQQLPAIMIAGVHGYVGGSSFAMMNFADMVIAAQFTRFNTGYMRFASGPDGAMSWWLPRLAGYRQALQWLLLAENLTPEELQAAGLINLVVPDEQLNDVLEKMAARILRAPPQCVSALKKLLLASQNNSIEQQMAMETEAMASLAASPDFQEGIRAFAEKRAPRFGLGPLR
ncbi:enoyl-CoA hydratase/isomerase family protein [Undibacterium squillarum]|uniref:2-(1,2-epoxy-1,2-dihydrophenyl)acetyl-CoA isomerase n=1 Tax=Undibacterium squillarum TaxID=1131567 RepID=A0ABQ2Y284_9BURK|nr:enoyl-CoA hydratase/isomerase family protein [Undibacterium squillarum]GGX50748.1 2-(1,2-epoxy-1,2-dihydrophenyl)acetyl-CoA isomerase [Undibacterium squillarum]